MSQNVGIDAAKIIDQAAKKAMIVGQGQAMSGSDVQDCFTELNMMLDEWSEQRASVLHLVDTTFTATGAASYTVGVGGTVNTASYPVRLESAYFGLNNINYPLEIVHAQEDFNLIALRTMTSFPEYAFLDTAYPLANLYLWPVPNSSYVVTITTMAALSEFQYLTDAVNLRPAYRSALVNNLAVRIAPMFGMEAPASVQRLAITSKRTIEKANTQIPLAQVDTDLLGSGHFNIYSGRVR